MKFLHLSDIHFDPVNDGEDTVNLRKQFIPVSYTHLTLPTT